MIFVNYDKIQKGLWQTNWLAGCLLRVSRLSNFHSIVVDFDASLAIVGRAAYFLQTVIGF